MEERRGNRSVCPGGRQLQLLIGESCTYVEQVQVRPFVVAKRLHQQGFHRTDSKASYTVKACALTPWPPGAATSPSSSATARSSLSTNRRSSTFRCAVTGRLRRSPTTRARPEPPCTTSSS